MKFKVEDKIRIVARKYSHVFSIGTVAKIIFVGESYYQCMNSLKELCIVEDDEIELFDIERLQMLEIENIL